MRALYRTSRGDGVSALISSYSSSSLEMVRVNLRIGSTFGAIGARIAVRPLASGGELSLLTAKGRNALRGEYTKAFEGGADAICSAVNTFGKV